MIDKTISHYLSVDPPERLIRLLADKILEKTR